MPFPIDLKYITKTEKELGLVFPDSFKTDSEKVLNPNIYDKSNKTKKPAITRLLQ